MKNEKEHVSSWPVGLQRFFTFSAFLLVWLTGICILFSLVAESVPWDALCLLSSIVLLASSLALVSALSSLTLGLVVRWFRES